MRFFAALLAIAFSSLAHSEYPERTVRIVVPYAPGGSVDIMARFIASKMKRTVVETKLGGGGLVAARDVEGARPDGYTLLMGNFAPNGVDPAWFWTPPQESHLRLVPVALVGGHPMVLISRDSSDARDFLAKVRHGGTFASDGLGGASQMSMLLAAPGGLHVPYKGGVPAAIDIAAGQVPGGFVGGPVALPWIQKGVHALAQTSMKRVAPYENIPTLKELGYNVELFAWTGLFAPVGTPEAVLDYWHEAVARETAASKDYLAVNGITLKPMTRAQFAAYVAAEQVKYREMAQKIPRD